ncbi:hypothetical protein ACQP1G_20535 [Nocardia sp. CA-107356]|uniref:hypothetical protein n=1 Tax=Nocardia sp. CA-107356 TaxID=3239972 RepID=UPI003D8CE74E
MTDPHPATNHPQSQRLSSPPAPDPTMAGQNLPTRNALIPPNIQTAPVGFDYTLNAIEDASLAGYARDIQNLEAQHTLLAEQAEREGFDPARIRQLERLNAAISAATRDAARSGLDQTDIDASYRAGRDGVFWHERPGARYLGRIEQLGTELAAARAEAAQVKTERDRLETDLVAVTNANTELDRQVARMQSEVLDKWMTRDIVDFVRNPYPSAAVGPEAAVTQPDIPVVAAEGGEPAAGQVIGEAIGAVIPDGTNTHWSPSGATAAPSQQAPGPSAGPVA